MQAKTLHSPHAPVLGLPQLLVPPQHLQDQLLLVLGQEAQVDGLCNLRHGAWKREPSAWVTCVQSLPRDALKKLRIIPLYYISANVWRPNCHQMWSRCSAVVLILCEWWEVQNPVIWLTSRVWWSHWNPDVNMKLGQIFMRRLGLN